MLGVDVKGSHSECQPLDDGELWGSCSSPDTACASYVHVSRYVLQQWSTIVLHGKFLVSNVKPKMNLVTHCGYTCPGVNETQI